MGFAGFHSVPLIDSHNDNVQEVAMGIGRSIN